MPQGRQRGGTVSGGCLEGDIAELSFEVVEKNQPQIVTYDTSSENEKVWGLGLGCNGTVEVLIEPLQWWREPLGRALFDEILGRVKKGKRCAVATVLAERGEQLPSLRRIIVEPDGKTIGSLGLARARVDGELSGYVRSWPNRRFGRREK